MLKFIGFKDRFAKVWPVACSLSGTALLLSAWKLASLESYQYNDVVFGLTVLLWALLPLTFAGLFVRPLVSSRIIIRFLTIFTFFIVGLISFKAQFCRDINAQCISLAGLFLIVLGLPAWQTIHSYLIRLGHFIRQHERISPRLFISGGFILYLATAITLSWYCFSFTPTYPDSMAQYVHGKFVAAGHLYYINTPALPDFFPVWMMVLEDGKWYSQYPPLHQTLLGIGHMIGAPWLINPLEGALTLVALYALTKRAYGENTARIACILMYFSPFVMFISAEFMNHASALLFTTLLIYTYGELQAALAEGARRKAYYWSLAAGLSSGCIFLTRPLVGVAMTLPFAVLILWKLKKNRHEYLKPFLLMAAGGLVCVLFQLWYNLQTTGNAFTYGYTRYHYNNFSIALGYSKNSSLINTLIKTRKEWFMMTIDLFEWSIPCLFFVILVCLSPIKHPTTRLLLAIIASQTLLDMLNQFSNYVFGPRYLYELATALIVLTAVGMMQLPGLLQFWMQSNSYLKLKSPDVANGMACLLIILITATGVVNRFPVKIKEFSHYMDSHPEFYQSMLKQSKQPALIFLGRQRADDPYPFDSMATFRWMAWRNPPIDTAPIIFAYDRGDERNRALIHYYPNRKAYVEMNERLTEVKAAPASTHKLVPAHKP